MAKIFISYGRASKDVVQQLAQDLKDDDQEVWFDQQLTGGQKWWDNILSQIRECEIFVAALTPNFLESRACQREMKYAGDLQKTLLPVRLSDKVSPDSLPPNLGELQWVDYSVRNVEALKSLQRTLRHMPNAPSLPDPLPHPPPVPISYLSSLRAKIETDSQLQLQDQIELVFELRQQFRKREPSDELLDLLQRLKSRDDLLARVGLDIDQLQTDIKGSRSDAEIVASHLIPQAGGPPFVEGIARPSRPSIAGTAAEPAGPQPPRSANGDGGTSEATKVSDEHRKTKSLSPALALSALGAALIVGSVSIGYFYLRPAPIPPVVSSPEISPPKTPQPAPKPQPQPVVNPPEISSPKTAKPGSEFTDCANVCPEMIVVPAGKFTMGSPENEPGRFASEGPQREVRITKPFAVSKYEVTFAQWDACAAAGACPQVKDNWGRGQMPVINVSWDEAKLLVGWLSRLTGKEYRLLTEAEWEYTARAGTTTRYFWGDDSGKGNANCDGCGSKWDNKQTAPVGSFKPNAFGLYDMAGNVWEWVADVLHDNYEGAPTDGSAWLQDGNPSTRVVRGGSWLHLPQNLRSATRGRFNPDYRGKNLGFRVARTLTL